MPVDQAEVGAQRRAQLLAPWEPAWEGEAPTLQHKLHNLRPPGVSGAKGGRGGCGEAASAGHGAARGMLAKLSGGAPSACCYWQLPPAHAMAAARRPCLPGVYEIEERQLPGGQLPEHDGKSVYVLAQGAHTMS